MSDPLPETDPAAGERGRLRALALSRWENEGGAALVSITTDEPSQKGVEADQLHIRVIALENLVIALLVDAADHRHTLARRRGPDTRRTG